MITWPPIQQVSLHDGLHGWPSGACRPAFQPFPASKPVRDSLQKTIAKKNIILDDLRLLIQGNESYMIIPWRPASEGRSRTKHIEVVSRKIKVYDHCIGPTCSFALVYFRGACFLYAKNSLSASDSS